MIRLRSPLRRESRRHDGIAGVVLGVESVPDGLAGGLLVGINETQVSRPMGLLTYANTGGRDRRRSGDLPLFRQIRAVRRRGRAARTPWSGQVSATAVDRRSRLVRDLPRAFGARMTIATVR
jgi:hypothetical protein